jgi:uncharacterized protein
MRKTFLIITLLFFFSGSIAIAGDITPEKKADIEKLMNITGALKIGKQMSNAVVNNMTSALKASRPDIPDRMYKILAEEINNIIEEQMFAKGGYIETTVLIYDKYFTHDDIKGLLSFYRTKLGKKTIQVLPQIVQSSMKAGQLWGQALGPLIQERVTKRFKEEGIDLST